MSETQGQASAFDRNGRQHARPNSDPAAVAAATSNPTALEMIADIFRPRMGLRFLLPFLRRASTAIHAGIDVRKFWEMEAKRAPAPFRSSFQDILERVSQGDTMAEAMHAQGELFPPMVRELVEVGEKTGRLEQVLERLAEHFDHMSRLKRAFISGITWPMMQLAAAAFIVGFLIWFLGEIVPAMGGQAVDILGFGLLGNSGLIAYLGILATIVAGAVLFYFAIMRQWFGDVPLRLVLRIPYIGNTIETMALARLTWTLSMALESGVDARGSIRMALRSSAMPHYLAVEKQVDQSIVSGFEFHQSLRDTRQFSGEFLNMLETAEISGRLSESMIHLSDEYSQRAETATKVLTTFATFGIWGCVATFIIFLIIRLFMFYLGTLQNALQGI
jgi:type II secretory pathway component PulF